MSSSALEMRAAEKSRGVWIEAGPFWASWRATGLARHVLANLIDLDISRILGVWTIEYGRAREDEKRAEVWETPLGIGGSGEAAAEEGGEFPRTETRSPEVRGARPCKFPPRGSTGKDHMHVPASDSAARTPVPSPATRTVEDRAGQS